jgi:hypothetical protein
MNLTLVNETLKKFYEPYVVAYIISPRFCRKHFTEMYYKTFKDATNYSVVSLLGICQYPKCTYVGEVHYLVPYKEFIRSIR